MFDEFGYIHLHEDWPDFRWQEPSLATRLANVRYRQGRLVGRMEALGLSLRDEATLENLTLDAVNSSSIEGEILRADQVRSSLARRLGLEAAALPPVDRHVEGMVDMTLDATQQYSSPLNAERLLNWHAALFPTGRSGMNRITVGAWRTDHTGPMQVVSGPAGRERVHFEAPAAGRVPAEMEAFLSWFEAEQSVDPVLKAGIAHLWFVTIHPFDDGNGRIARAITDMALARSEGQPRRFYSMSAQIQRERDDYYGVLERTQRGSLDVTEWLIWFQGCLDRALDGSETTLSAVLRKARFWEAHASTSLNDRQRRVISRLLNGFTGRLTNSRWTALTKCSPDTALRDIRDLVDKGILARDAAGGRSTGYTLVEPA